MGRARNRGPGTSRGRGQTLKAKSAALSHSKELKLFAQDPKLNTGHLPVMGMKREPVDLSSCFDDPKSEIVIVSYPIRYQNAAETELEKTSQMLDLLQSKMASMKTDYDDMLAKQDLKLHKMKKVLRKVTKQNNRLIDLSEGLRETLEEEKSEQVKLSKTLNELVEHAGEFTSKINVTMMGKNLPPSSTSKEVVTNGLSVFPILTDGVNIRPTTGVNVVPTTDTEVNMVPETRVCVVPLTRVKVEDPTIRKNVVQTTQVHHLAVPTAKGSGLHGGSNKPSRTAKQIYKNLKF